ncbi:hypothetical protein CSQ85_08785 [Bifidobacterium rousetti]|uniref:hypothetical protein n=1 Tax=Bifidobacterium rousetti TaxID=2045439 RepID=UPI00123B0857|nr:hypothetical protein [Bifidobacterium rousetti]KAA8818246.1 hypothetical protein CSQ85_08785 [Bifidobacterium rousetti]
MWDFINTILFTENLDGETVAGTMLFAALVVAPFGLAAIVDMIRHPDQYRHTARHASDTEMPPTYDSPERRARVLERRGRN